MEQEIWKDIPGFEGSYQASNLGRIKSLKNNTQKILHISKNNIGYTNCKLSKKGKSKTFSIHRLIAKTFLLNLENKPCINHIDGNKHNNNIKNLEWVTHSENTIHSIKILGNKIGLNKSKKVNQYDLEGNFIKTWDKSTDIKKYFKIPQQCISRVCLGKRKTAGGFIWKYF